MNVHCLLIIHYFSLTKLVKQKNIFKHKICYREKLIFLQNKQTPVSSIVTRVMRQGFYIKMLRTLMKFFVNLFLPYVRKLHINNEFRSVYLYNYSLRDFNRILFWKISTINALFNIKKTKKKQFVYYLKKGRRISTVLLWLKQIIKMKQNLIKNNNPSLFYPLFSLLTNNTKINQLHGIKLKIYRARLIRGY